MAAKDGSPETTPDAAVMPAPQKAVKPGNAWYVFYVLSVMTLNAQPL